jgi:hypothetical protein
MDAVLCRSGATRLPTTPEPATIVDTILLYSLPISADAEAFNAAADDLATRFTKSAVVVGTVEIWRASARRKSGVDPSVTAMRDATPLDSDTPPVRPTVIARAAARDVPDVRTVAADVERGSAFVDSAVMVGDAFLVAARPRNNDDELGSVPVKNCPMPT